MAGGAFTLLVPQVGVTAWSNAIGTTPGSARQDDDLRVKFLKELKKFIGKRVAPILVFAGGTNATAR
jgi:hypothetical protein